MRKVRFRFLTKGTQPSSGRAGIQTQVVLLENTRLDRRREEGGPLSWVRRISWSLPRRTGLWGRKGCLSWEVPVPRRHAWPGKVEPKPEASQGQGKYPLDFMVLIFQAQSSWSSVPRPCCYHDSSELPQPLFLTLLHTLLPHYQVNLLTLNISSGLQTCRYNCLWAAFRCLTVSLRSKPRSPALLAGTCSASNVPSSSCQHHPPTCSSWKAGSCPGHLPLPHPHIPQPVLFS